MYHYWVNYRKKQLLSDSLKWANLHEVRDLINQHAYASVLKPPIISSLLGGLGFVSVLLVAQFWMNQLIFQFIVGAILLFVVESLIKQLFKHRESWFMKNLKIPVLEELELPVLGLLRSLMQLHAERSRYFPIQQNMLLVIALILIPGMDPGPESSIVIRSLIYALFGGLYCILKIGESFHNQTQAWTRAAQAVQKIIQEKSV